MQTTQFQSESEYDRTVKELATDALDYEKDRGVDPSRAAYMALKRYCKKLAKSGADHDFYVEVNKHGSEPDEQYYEALKARARQEVDDPDFTRLKAIARLHTDVKAELHSMLD